MTRHSSNGLAPIQNLAHQRRKPVFEKRAEAPTTKCKAHPTKRMWTDPAEAVREAKVRTEVTPGIEIVAYRCDACGNAHLCKAENARKGTVLTDAAPERNFEVFPLQPTNPEARRKLIAKFVEGRGSVTTKEIMAATNIQTQTTIAKYMRELGWSLGTGRHAKWTPPAATALRPVPTLEDAEVAQDFADHELEAAIQRHPAGQPNPWDDLATDRVRHLGVGDLLDALDAAGIEVRIQTRRSAAY